MKPQLSHRDYEQISVYLDGGLTSKDRARLEARLQSDQDFKDAFQKIQQTRLLLKRLPKMRAPRNFTLTPHMVSKPVKHSVLFPRSYYTLRLSAVLSSIVLVFVLLGDLLSSGPQPAFAPMAGAPAQVEQLALPAAATNEVGVMKEVPPGEAGNTLMATGLPMATAAADMVAANINATQPLPVAAATQAAQPAAMPEAVAQSKEALSTPTLVEIAPTALSSVLPTEAEETTLSSAVEAPAITNIPLPSPPMTEQITPTNAIQKNIPPAGMEQRSSVIILWRVVETILFLFLLVTGISAWWVRRNP